MHATQLALRHSPRDARHITLLAAPECVRRTIRGPGGRSL